jgi:hypothetical protein
MRSAFIITDPKRTEFKANITDNLSVFKAELLAIILLLLVYLKDTNITIHVDAVLESLFKILSFGQVLDRFWTALICPKLVQNLSKTLSNSKNLSKTQHCVDA